MRDAIEAATAIRPPDDSGRAAALGRQRTLTKPAGSLGRLEEIAVWMAGVRRMPLPAIGRKTIVVAAGDHGVAHRGVSAYPPDVTAQMVRNFLAGGAAINVLAAQAGADLRIVDAGVATDIVDPRLHVAKLRPGAGDITAGPAMSRDEAVTLLDRGVAFAREICAGGECIVALGDMGIGNTTSAAGITSAIAGIPPRATAGRGTGVDDAAFARKVDAIERALAVNRPDPADGVDVLAKVGGCELAFLAGVAIGAAACGAPVVIDGYPTTAAALCAVAIAPALSDDLLAAHASAEPGHRIALDHLGLRPLLDLDMRLGEGTGAALALTLIDAALALHRDMATFDSAGVSRSTDETQPEA
jgi:nicotinate-nucleotide--dimethylbenzimidazole phosphoribosyltransferase